MPSCPIPPSDAIDTPVKILTTALCSVFMLRRRLTTTKWVSLFFLAVGVAIVQLQTVGNPTIHTSTTSHVMNPLTGFLAVSAACVTSGLAGVYFEMVLKGSSADLWIRNVQLSLFSLLPALLPAFFPNFSLVPFFFPGSSSETFQPAERPPWLFENFGFWAWATVLCQVVGGLVTALVIKYSDNILKGFATSLSIVLSFLAGVCLFDFRITISFVLGCSTVLGATYLYNKPSPRNSVSPTLPGTGGHQSVVGSAGPVLTNPFSLVNVATGLANGGHARSPHFYDKASPPMDPPPRATLPALNMADLIGQASVRRPHNEATTPPSFSPGSAYFDNAEKGSISQVVFTVDPSTVNGSSSPSRYPPQPYSHVASHSISSRTEAIEGMKRHPGRIAAMDE
jgi:drug/metabolite transporter (DMT)-like permease